MRAWLTDLTPDSHNSEIASLIDDLAGLDPAVAAYALHACAPHLRSSLENDLADVGHGLSHWAFGHMSMIAPLARARMQSIRCNQAVAEHRRVDGRVVEHYLDETADDDRITNHPGKRWEPPQDVSDLAAAVLEVMKQVDWTAAGTSLAGRSDDEVQALDSFLVWLASLSTDFIDGSPKSCSTAVRHDGNGDRVAAG